MLITVFINLVFSLGNIRTHHGFQRENIQHTNVHLVVPDTRALLKVWFKYIYICQVSEILILARYIMLNVDPEKNLI